MITPFHLNGKTILVTGASSGIGRQCCRAIASMGGCVIASGRNLKRLQETCSDLEGDGHISIRADLSIEEERQELIAQSPQLNGLVFAAGSHKLKPLKYIDDAFLGALQKINYEAPLLLSRELLRSKKLAAGSSCVFISSIAAVIGSPGNSVYSGSKGALAAFARVMAVELAPQSIRVNTLAPGMVRTPMTDKIQSQLSPELLAADEKRYPLGYGQPEDVAHAAVYLLSDAARWVTGSCLVIDGGFTCQ